MKPETLKVVKQGIKSAQLKQLELEKDISDLKRAGGDVTDLEKRAAENRMKIRRAVNVYG